MKYASIGYDSTTGTVLIFGGESNSGFPSQQTYLCVPTHHLRFLPLIYTLLQAQHDIFNLVESRAARWIEHETTAEK